MRRDDGMGTDREGSELRLRWPDAAEEPARPELEAALGDVVTPDEPSHSGAMSGTTAAVDDPPLDVRPPTADANGGLAVGMRLVEGFDRASDRLLERLRSLRQDIDADLTFVRSELV